TCGVMVAIQPQSADIAIGVDKSFEVRREGLEDAFDETGAGDQGMMIGYACRDTEELMPMPIAVAHRLAKRLADVRRAGVLPYLRPDGKSQVTIEYEDGRPVRVDTVVISAQHREEVDIETLLRPDVEAEVIEPVLKEMDLEAEGLRVLVNPTGRFEIGGPKADTGLTGRKIMVDSYGSMAPHGGGCFSGKDPTRVDRSAAYMARYVAKNIEPAGTRRRLRRRAEARPRHALDLSAGRRGARGHGQPGVGSVPRPDDGGVGGGSRTESPRRKGPVRAEGPVARSVLR